MVISLSAFCKLITINLEYLNSYSLSNGLCYATCDINMKQMKYKGFSCLMLVGNVKKDLSPFAPGMLMVCSLYALEALSI